MAENFVSADDMCKIALHIRSIMKDTDIDINALDERYQTLDKAAEQDKSIAENDRRINDMSKRLGEKLQVSVGYYGSERQVKITHSGFSKDLEIGQLVFVSLLIETNVGLTFVVVAITKDFDNNLQAFEVFSSRELAAPPTISSSDIVVIVPGSSYNNVIARYGFC